MCASYIFARLLVSWIYVTYDNFQASVLRFPEISSTSFLKYALGQSDSCWLVWAPFQCRGRGYRVWGKLEVLCTLNSLIDLFYQQGTGPALAGKPNFETFQAFQQKKKKKKNNQVETKN